MMTIRLDEDLDRKLQKTLQRKGLVWRHLPTTLQLKLLKPLLEEQARREAEVLEGLGCVA